MLMQKDLNRIHHKRKTKEKELEQARNLLEMLEMDFGEDNLSQDTIKQREGELEETVQGLNNELYYQETLEYMLHCHKLNLLAMKKPINQLKKELTKVKTEIQTVKTHNRRAKTASTFFRKSIEDFQQTFAKRKTMREQAVEQDLEQLKNKERLQILLNKEQQFHKESAKQQENAKRLKSLEGDLERLKDEEVIFDEIKQIENHCINEERKFKKIQSVTNISSIVDMEPYWRYLVENRESLERAVEQVQIQIEELNQERAQAEKELHSLSLETEERKRINPREVEEMEETLKIKMKLLEEGEHGLTHLNDLVASANNSISRIAFQLADRPEIVDIQPGNMSENLTFCSIKLEQMLASLLKRNVMHLEESVNSDIQVKLPPEYMHINFETFARKDSDRDEYQRKGYAEDVEMEEVENLLRDRWETKFEKQLVLREFKAANAGDLDSEGEKATRPKAKGKSKSHRKR